MRRYSFAVFAALSGPAFSIAQESPPIADIAHEPSLQVAVTEKLAMAPLPEALKTLSKDSGVPIEATMSMSGQKLTVLVKNQPVGVVLARIADVFHGEWRKSGDLYRLSIPSEWTSAESAFIRAEDDARRKHAEEVLRGIMAGTSIPYAQVLQELSGGKASAKRQEELEKVKTPGAYLLGYTFAHMSNAQWQTFWAGRPVRASVVLPVNPPTTDSPPPVSNTRSGQRAVTQQDSPQGASKPIQTQAIRVFATYDPFTGTLRTSEGGIGAAAGAEASLISHPYPDGDLVSLPYAKEVLAWSRVEADSPALTAKVSGQVSKGSYFAGQRSLSDVLTWLHDSTGLSIVADAFRVPVRISSSASGNAGAWLQNLAQTNHEFLRTENGFVMMRHGGFWRLKALELPESTYKKIEAAKPAGLDDYAAFAGSLSPEQALPFRIAGAVLTRFDPEPLRTGMTALRFYATLGGAERQAVAAGKAVPYGRLSATGRERFVEAMEDPLGQSVGSGMPNINDSRVAASLGFLMGSANGERMVADASGFAHRAVGTSRTFLFGTGPRDGIQFLLPID